MRVGEQTIDLSSPRVMTIVNVTPDSFYAGSRTFTVPEIERRVEEAVEQGADMLDVGGYSSRPGAGDVPLDEESRRIARALQVIRRRLPQMPVSIDTFRAEVVRRAVAEFGPCAVNDISAGELDARMVPTVAALGVPYVAMHMRGTPARMQSLAEYDNVVREVHYYFIRRLRALASAGVREVVLDPGFGFAKTVQQSYRLLGGLHALTELGCPVLVGLSRKSMIYNVLGCRPEEALHGTTALHWECLRQGASILRVHDTRPAAEAVRLWGMFERSCK